MVAMNKRFTLELVFIIRTGVQWQVMERSLYVVFFEECHQLGTERQIGAYQVIHVSVIRSIGWYLR